MTADVLHIKDEADEQATALSGHGAHTQHMQPSALPPQSFSNQLDEAQFAQRSSVAFSSGLPVHNYHHFQQPAVPRFTDPNYNAFAPPSSTAASSHSASDEASPFTETAVGGNEPEPVEPKPKRRKRKSKHEGGEEEERAAHEAERAAQAARPGHHRIEIPSARSGNADPAQVFAASGPMSQGCVLPGRKKPGRKPMESAGAGGDRRREQNREAQRKFRQVRNIEIEQLRSETTQLQMHCDERGLHIDNLKANKTQLMAENERLVERAAELEVENRRILNQHDDMMEQLQNANDNMAALQEQINHLRGANNRSDSFTHPTTATATGMMTIRQPQTRGPGYDKLKFAAPLTPPDHNAYETDFTNLGHTVPPTTTHDSDIGPSGLGDDRCGFCTDAQNCLCKGDSGPVPEIEQPGNCSACLADPQRAQACRQLAASALTHSFGFRPLHDSNGVTVSSGSQSLSRADSGPSARISCEQLMDRAQKFGARLPSISKLFGDQIRAHPTASGRYEVEEHEAAQALQTLATRCADLEKAKV